MNTTSIWICAIIIIWHLMWLQAVARQEVVQLIHHNEYYAIISQTNSSPHHLFKVFVSNSQKYVIEPAKLNCDGDFVSDCNRVKPDSTVHRINLTRQVDSFTLNIQIYSTAMNRRIFQFDFSNACRFLSNPQINKFFSNYYNAYIVNNTYFHCPLKPQIYYINNQLKVKWSLHHPVGKFGLIVIMNAPRSRNPYILQVLCNYTVSAAR